MNMADIEIIYREGYCECKGGDYCMQCHTLDAEDLGCKMFNEGKHEKNVIPFGDCIYANFKYIYKGMSIKNYELEVDDYPYNPHLNCMMLKTRKDWYECEKVVLNGKVIYGEDFEPQAERSEVLLMTDTDIMPLICIKCRKYIPLTYKTMKEVSYTHYSYCEDCLRKGLKALKSWDELYKKIYDHHYEIIKSEPSESRNAKLSLSNWILDTMTGEMDYDYEPQAERSDKE